MKPRKIHTFVQNKQSTHMIKDDFFTAEEKTQITELYKRLYTVSKDVLLPDDDQKVRYYIRKAGEKGLLQRDTFNLNPIINDAETALIVAEEIGLNRASILGVMLNGVVLSGAASIDEIKKDFGEAVSEEDTISDVYAIIS